MRVKAYKAEIQQQSARENHGAQSLETIGYLPDRTSGDGNFRLWTLRSAVVILALQWTQRITDGGIASGLPGKSAESFAACASALRTIRTKPHLELAERGLQPESE